LIDPLLWQGHAEQLVIAVDLLFQLLQTRVFRARLLKIPHLQLMDLIISAVAHQPRPFASPIKRQKLPAMRGKRIAINLKME
jgi:hypothetical protein